MKRNTASKGGVRASGTTNAVLVAIGSTAAVCAAVAVAYAKLFPPPQPAPCRCIDASSARTDTPKSDAILRALTTFASSPEDRPAPPPPPPPQAAEVAAEVTTETSGAFESSAEEIEAKAKAGADAMNAQLASEEADPCWAPSTERATMEAVARLGLRATDVTCRETLCRVRLIHREPRLADEDLRQLMSISVITSQAQLFVPPDEAGSTVLYFSRKGMSLSALEPPIELPLAAFDDQEPTSESQP